MNIQVVGLSEKGRLIAGLENSKVLERDLPAGSAAVRKLAHQLDFGAESSQEHTGIKPEIMVLNDVDDGKPQPSGLVLPNFVAAVEFATGLDVKVKRRPIFVRPADGVTMQVLVLTA